MLDDNKRGQVNDTKYQMNTKMKDTSNNDSYCNITDSGYFFKSLYSPAYSTSYYLKMDSGKSVGSWGDRTAFQKLKVSSTAGQLPTCDPGGLQRQMQN